MNSSIKIILASASPRRKEILEKFGLNFEVMTSNIEENIHTDETPEQVTMALALEKALAVAELCGEGDIIIAADTVVATNKILGKPTNYSDAYGMLKYLQGNIHEVITGIAVVQANSYKKYVAYERTKVKIKQLTDDKIKRYIETGEVWDKAGSYAIQGKGSILVEWIQGEYFNVVGLPMNQLEKILSQYFGIELI